MTLSTEFEWRDRLNEANQRIIELEGHLQNCNDREAKWMAKVGKLTWERDRLQEALEKYGRHFLDCESLKDPPECHCGFLEALNKADTK